MNPSFYRDGVSPKGDSFVVHGSGGMDTFLAAMKAYYRKGVTKAIHIVADPDGFPRWPTMRKQEFVPAAGVFKTDKPFKEPLVGLQQGQSLEVFSIIRAGGHFDITFYEKTQAELWDDTPVAKDFQLKTLQDWKAICTFSGKKSINGIVVDSLDKHTFVLSVKPFIIGFARLNLNTFIGQEVATGKMVIHQGAYPKPPFQIRRPIEMTEREVCTLAGMERAMLQQYELSIRFNNGELVKDGSLNLEVREYRPNYEKPTVFATYSAGWDDKMVWAFYYDPLTRKISVKREANNYRQAPMY